MTIIQMFEQSFQNCVSEVCSDEFNKMQFLRQVADIASRPDAKVGLAVIYSLYHFLHTRNFKKSLEFIEHGMQMKPEDVTVSMLFSIRAGILSNMDKPSEALLALKQAVNIAASASYSLEQSHLRKAFPQIQAKVISNINVSRGRRQFLVLFDGMRVKVGSLNGLEQLERIAYMKVAQIKDHMKHSCRDSSHEKVQERSGLSSSRREKSPHTSIYINRLYEERKFALGKRQNSVNKSSKVIDPYQWRNNDRESSSGHCQYM